MSFITKNIVKKIAKQYNLPNGNVEKNFDVLWEVFQVGNQYRRRRKREDELTKALQNNYRALVAAILNKDKVEFGNVAINFKNSSVFKRIKTLSANNISNSSALASENYSKFVIFSDHHMTDSNHSHSYFSSGKNKSLYKEVLNYYADNDFGLIENGDVEEYTIFEPTKDIIARYKKLVKKGSFLGIKQDIGSIKWEDLYEERIRNRRKIVAKIANEHHDLYDMINDKFIKKGSRYYTKVTGNHDPYIDSRIIEELPEFLWESIYDAIRINYQDSNGVVIDEPLYFITHGHQFDTNTLPQHAFAIGEVFSETLGYFIQGADKVWTELKTDQWRNPTVVSSFRNILSHGRSNVNFSRDTLNAIGENLLEILIQNHEIAWEYFDNQSKVNAFFREVWTGNEYFKIRHLSETDLVDKLIDYQKNTALSSFKKPTKLIIGHTHEPRLNARKSSNSTKIISNYINCGSAGRFENLIWGIELVDGSEKIISWTNTGTNTNVKLHRNEWIPTEDGRFHKREFPLS